MTLIAGAATLGVAVATYGVLDAHDRVPGILTIDRDPSTPGATAAAGAPVTSDGAPVPRVAVPTPAGSATSTAAPAPAAGALRGALAPALADPRLGPSVGLTVRDGMTGAHLLDVAADQPRTPASTTKLLTAAAVVPALGPETRLVTSTVLAPDGRVVLRAGGDMMLARGPSRPGEVQGHAGVATLAAQTAAALRSAGRTTVTLGLDLSHAAGPDYAPTWDRAYLGEAIVGKVAMLGLADGLVAPGAPAPADPAGEVAAVLRTELGRAGISVRGDLARSAAPAGSRALASVSSAPVADVMAVALARSDNAVTESLARQAATRAGASGGFAAAARWVQGELARRGYDLTGVRLADTSGLSAGTTVPARLVGDVLVAGTSGRDPGMARVVEDLPVAGLSGTLAGRYVAGASAAGAGVVRAKTGTLTGISSLGGTVVDADGRLLAFAVLADDVPAAGGTEGARAALDALVTRLATCGCR
ncbi:D-alanyl-D-alanine carboxypeptidase/D-alanyl-D-alanine-endopeptidase [Arsenicicoccus cauae]|uniref:D-alanyl-D-alanine carboxypeptidase/D-alanyl-D-alanine endopeptidase n=1 Tax=Arsenicicoccus cauae TaxID=2663847 RepID=UPI00370DE033